MTPTAPVHPVPMDMARSMEDAPTGPQRHLDRRLADAIRKAKEETGLSWRGLAAATGVSTAHLNHLSLGRRVPSRQVAEVVIAALGLDDEIAEGLRSVAVPPWWKRRAEL